MKICSRCGNEYDENLIRCPKCGLGQGSSTYRYSTDQVKSSFSSSNIKESLKSNQFKPELSNLLKVLMTFFISLVPYIGAITGLGFGIYYRRRKNADTKQFGNVIVVMSSIWLTVTVCVTIIVSIIFIQINDELLQFYKLTM